jgi:hypothetical protein
VLSSKVLKMMSVIDVSSLPNIELWYSITSWCMGYSCGELDRVVYADKVYSSPCWLSITSLESVSLGAS